MRIYVWQEAIREVVKEDRGEDDGTMTMVIGKRIQ